MCGGMQSWHHAKGSTTKYTKTVKGEITDEKDISSAQSNYLFQTRPEMPHPSFGPCMCTHFIDYHLVQIAFCLLVQQELSSLIRATNGSWADMQVSHITWVLPALSHVAVWQRLTSLLSVASGAPKGSRCSCFCLQTMKPSISISCSPPGKN